MINYSELDDNRLQELAAVGDRQAEERLVVKYMRLVRRCSRPFFLVGGAPEDLIQEGMLGLLSAIRQYDPKQNAAFKTYAELCIKNRLLSAVKTDSRLKHNPLNDGLPLDLLLSEESQIPLLAYTELFRRTPEEQVLARENKMELQQSFKRCLSPMERNVLRLYLDGLSYQEIAEQTGKPIKAVDNAIQRIRRKLAQNLDSGVISKS
ncbi:MAG: sigma-70 family RNA polymerase sigma factor [Oscillospiraceae bacterium]|nr:sigma-70 family RNA polymerase sigma factor [Oscillospiraceae bacterium]